MKKYIKLLIPALALLPLVASAQLTGLGELITATGGLINPLIAILVGVALLVFFWGLVKFVFRLGGDGEKAVDDGKRLMKWGLIALFVMVSVWGIIEFFQDALLGGVSPTPTDNGGSGNIPPRSGDFQ
ncbi:MAG: hypothetical protein AAB719_01160 [Patescibacteria group bacterium]